MTKPSYIPPNYVGQAHPDIFTTRPFAEDFAARRAAFFQQVLKHPAPPRGSKGAFFEVARLAAGAQPDEAVIEKALTEYIDGRLDCADFVMQAILRMLYQFGEGANTPGIPPSNVDQSSAQTFSQELLAHAKAATLGFKYWPDEPGTDSMCTWTENHQILLSTSAYLAGQLYPQEVFKNSGRKGHEMMDIHRPRIDRWMRMRFKSGFSEWLSNVYYDEDWAPLLNLVDFAQDEELQERARIILDLSLFDMALNSFQGVFGSTHGRSYEQNKKWAALEGTTNTSKLLFGTGAFSNYDNMSVVLFALSANYCMPQVIYDIAHDDALLENRQRMGFRVQDAAQWGLTYDDLESGMVFYSNEAYLHPKTAKLTVRMFDEFRWWENDFFKEFKPFRKLLYTIRTLRLLPTLGHILEKDICRNMRDEANIFTYRTPDYMLSTAQDHRAGFGGDQHHIWQATLGPDAVCFTTHPAKIEGVSPNYWTGSGLLPRVAQYKNLAIAIYNIKKIPALYVPIRHFFTHAWLPRDQFDQVIEKENWIFARQNEGYLALRSQQPYFWNTPSEAKHHTFTFGHYPEDMNREIIADGAQNIWLCQLGRRTDNGSFEQFIATICKAELRFDGLNVQFQSPGNGLIQFGWHKHLRLDGTEVPLKDYPRYDNLYTQAEFWPHKIDIRSQNNWLALDWQTGTRTYSNLIE
jgi:hypothetical protein